MSACAMMTSKSIFTAMTSLLGSRALQQRPASCIHHTTHSYFTYRKQVIMLLNKMDVFSSFFANQKLYSVSNNPIQTHGDSEYISSPLVNTKVKYDNYNISPTPLFLSILTTVPVLVFWPELLYPRATDLLYCSQLFQISILWTLDGSFQNIKVIMIHS